MSFFAPRVCWLFASFFFYQTTKQKSLHLSLFMKQTNLFHHPTLPFDNWSEILHKQTVKYSLDRLFILIKQECHSTSTHTTCEETKLRRRRKRTDWIVNVTCEWQLCKAKARMLVVQEVILPTIQIPGHMQPDGRLLAYEQNKGLLFIQNLFSIFFWVEAFPFLFFETCAKWPFKESKNSPLFTYIVASSFSGCDH